MTTKQTIIFWTLSVVFTAFMVIPYRTTTETINREHVTHNYLFAGDIVYNGQRIGASSELCARLAFGNEPQITVEKMEYVFFTKRVPLKSEGAHQ